MRRLVLEIEPATEWPDSSNLAWLHFGLLDDEKVKERLFSVVLESASQIDYLLEKEIAIRQEILPIPHNSSRSIATEIALFYESCSETDTEEGAVERALEALLKYREEHGIWFAFRGQDIPNIYVAKNDAGYEISSADAVISFCHEIDIESFFGELTRIRHKYTKEFH